MRNLFVFLLLSSGFLAAQNSSAGVPGQQKSKDSTPQVTVQGCVDRSRGNYVLIVQDRGMMYQLQGTNKTKLGPYMGHQVEVTGTKQTSLSTSSDSIAFGGSPSPVTILVSSIKVLAAQCSAAQVPH